jgi:hypothetical protein
MDMVPFRQRLRARRVVSRGREQLAFRRRVVELFGYRPSDADHGGAANVFTDRRAADPDRSGDRPLARPTGVPRAELLEPSASTISPRASDLQLRESQKEHFAQLRLPTTLPASPYQQGGRLRSDQVAAFDRIGWPLSVGIGGRIPSESARPDVHSIANRAKPIGHYFSMVRGQRFKRKPPQEPGLMPSSACPIRARGLTSWGCRWRTGAPRPASDILSVAVLEVARFAFPCHFLRPCDLRWAQMGGNGVAVSGRPFTAFSARS